MNIHTGRNGRAKPKLGQKELDQIISAVGGAQGVEDIYPLSPLQQGILFHSLYAPQSTVYVETRGCRLRGSLDIDAFKCAWERAVERHTVLRTAFVGLDLEVPVQVVLRRVVLPFEQYDWRDLPRSHHEERFQALQQADRERG